MKGIIVLDETIFNLLIICFVASSAPFAHATNNNADILRGIHLKAYAYEVVAFTIALEHLILINVLWFKMT